MLFTLYQTTNLSPGPNLTLSKTSPGFYVSEYKSFENTMQKGQIIHKEQFLLFPQCFLPFWRTFCHFHLIWNCRLQTLSVWNSLKFVVCERVKACADEDLKMAPMTLFIFYREKKMQEKENMWVPGFSPFPTMFTRGLFSRVVKTRNTFW